MQKIKKLFSSTQFKNGNYSILLMVIVIAIVVVINLAFGQLPSKIKSLDMSETQIYSIGDTTKEVLDGLEKDINIKVVVESGQMESRIETFLNHYSDASKHISIEYIDPVLYPSILTEYSTEANSIVVECPDTQRTKTISFGDIILYDTSSYYYTGNATETGFDGEGQITSAINYVSGENSKKIYTLSGHGESSFSASVTDLIQKANLETASLNLMTDDIPEDCDLLVLYAPTKDLAGDELTKLTEYVDSGKNIMIIPTLTTEPLANLTSLVSQYGLNLTNTYIGDKSDYYKQMRSYYNFFPALSSSSSINSGMDSDSLVLLSAAGGMTQADTVPEELTIEPFMTTSEQGFQMNMETQEEAENTAGQYILGAAVTKKINDEQSAKIIVMTADSIINETITSQFQNLSNLDEFINALTWYFDDVENVSIPSKSLQVTNNTFTATGGFSMLYIAIIPVAVLAGGFAVWMKRRKA